MKLSESQREQLAKVLSAANGNVAWDNVNAGWKEAYRAEAGAAYAYLRPIILAEALSKPTDDEMRGAYFCTEECCAPSARQLFANRLKALSAPPVDKAVEAVTGLLREGGPVNDMSVLIVAAVRKADSEASNG